LDEAGIDRSSTYLTNAVKHFKWRRSGKGRLHQKPNASEVAACRNWWEAQAVFGRDFRVTRDRGSFRVLGSGVTATATIHPSAALRADNREELFAGLVLDLGAVATKLKGRGTGAGNVRE